MDIQQRLVVFFRRLTEAPPAANASEALRLVCRLIEEVENEFCPVPRRTPPPVEFTGRMYAPQPDRMAEFPDGRIEADTRHHRIVCHPNGNISIVHKPGNVTVFLKERKP